MNNLKSITGLLVTSMLLIGCGGGSSDSHDPQLRAVHLSPDAPAVDIKVGDSTPLTGVEYRQASGFLSVDKGSTDISVLVPALDGASALDATLVLENDMKYTVIAADTVANGLPLTPIVVVDDINSPADGNADITIIHGAPSAPSVDVYVTAPGAALPESPVLSDIPFNTTSDELSLPAGDYQVRITPAGSTAVVYDSGALTLVDGVEYIAIAADDADPANLVGLTILTDLESTPFLNVNNAQEVAVAPKALLRAVHLSPDAPAVDISINDAVALSDVVYRTASGFVPVDSGSTDISVLVPALDGASALDATLDLVGNMKYTVIAANTVANGLPLTPIVVADDVNDPAAGEADITIIHGAPSAPAVDIYVTAPNVDLPASPLLSNIPFNTTSDELSVPAGDYQVRITPAGSTVVVYDSGTINLVDGVEYIAIAADDTNSENLVGLTILTDLESTPFVNADSK